MNQGDLISAILSAKEADWNALFETFRQQQYTKLRSAKTDADRLEIQANVKAFDFVQSKFTDIRQTKKISA